MIVTKRYEEQKPAPPPLALGVVIQLSMREALALRDWLASSLVQYGIAGELRFALAEQFSF